METSNPIHVVAAIFTKGEKVLACRRAPHKSSPGLWEFPGGKVEAGESSFAALEREIKEELGFECKPSETFDVSITKVGERISAFVSKFWIDGSGEKNYRTTRRQTCY